MRKKRKKAKFENPVDKILDIIKRHPSVKGPVQAIASTDIDGSMWTVRIKGEVPEWIAITALMLSLPPLTKKSLILNSKTLDLSEYNVLV